MKFRVYRYDPDQDEAPRMQDYDIALEHHDRMLLDALIQLKAHDDTLAFRRSCREGVCGSDAMKSRQERARLQHHLKELKIGRAAGRFLACR